MMDDKLLQKQPQHQPHHDEGAMPRRQTVPSRYEYDYRTTVGTSTTTTPSRPPTQVFTRGTTGAVKTRKKTSERRSRSHLRPNTATRSLSAHDAAPRRHRGPYDTAHQPHLLATIPQEEIPVAADTFTTASSTTNPSTAGYTTTPSLQPRYGMDSASASDQDGSVQSAPSLHSHRIHNETREPVHRYTYREFSPSSRGSQGSGKLHTKISRRVMDDLSRAQGSERRIAALSHVCECFDHNDEIKHNVELANGAVQVLAKCLLVATYDDEVRMICAALEMVLRGSPRAVLLAYSKVGGSALVANLLRILDRCESDSMKHADISILNIAKILCSLSRCPELRVGLCRVYDVVDSLQRVAVTPNADCRLVRIRTLANLANCEGNKVFLYERKGMVDAIVRVAHLEPSDVARQYAASVLMDLASAPQNQVAMANDDKVLGTLIKMTLVEKSTMTRESVITALQNLAFAKENRYRLVSFRDGVLLEALKQALASDVDPKARRRAAGALTNLVCPETAELMGNHKGLLDTLALVTTKDDNQDVQTRASLALTKIANCISVRMNCHETLLDALVVASLSKASTSVFAVLRVKARDPENRETMARHPGVMDTLADICVSDSSKVNDRDNAMRALMHLVNETKNRKILCNKTVLDALVLGANYKDPDLEEARDSAVRAMERLATEHTNREPMARHPGLLTAVAQAVEREAKWEDAGRESEHGYLAKPLLMSLLVSM